MVRFSHMKRELPKAYNPHEHEDSTYEAWEKSGFFNPDTCIEKEVTAPNAAPFSIVLPPPNVTGTLHLGHAAMLAIEDIMVRYHRMRGDRTLWLPGTDHAAIATQEKVERILWNEERKTRHDLGREVFLGRVKKFAQDSHDTIVNQCKKIGASLDWSREAYTLDESRNQSVNKAFQQMFEDGIIYRGPRIVNWDPKFQTTVSDDEVDRREEKAPFYYLQYGPFVIGTARPETKFGDKYVVVHPADERYATYQHGQKIENIEWINGKITATLIKDEAIDMDFGTGAMTITPWHDATDFDIAERHHLDKEQIIGYDGKLLDIAGEFAGMDISDARTKIVEKLAAKGLVTKTDENYVHNVAVNSRGGGVIEPQIKEQWFIDVNKEFERDGKNVTLKSLMQNAVHSGDVNIIPERFKKTYFHWIDNLRDWCISRQILFGHRIPVWYCLSCGKEKIDHSVKSRWFFMRHGETDHNVQSLIGGTSEVLLNKNGQEQARRAAAKLATDNIEVIFSSPFLRTQETARIIANEVGIQEVVLDERFRERCMGDAEGLPDAEVKEKYPDFRHYTGKSANQESFQETEARIWSAVSEHLTSHAHKNVLIVSHAGTLRALWRKIRNVDPERIMIDIEKFPNAEPLSIDVLDPCDQCGHHFFEQDPDTLDTWFSSGLWTFSTLGWGSDDKQWDREKIYHPTSVLETGYDILFFWVARMILMSEYLLGEAPFKTTYLHGLIRDEQGRKMSKSLGNVIDPLDVSAKYGTDAVRLALVIGSTPGNDIRIGEEKIASFRNFTNKLWNIGRYVIQQSAISNQQSETEDGRLKVEDGIWKMEDGSDADHWIFFRLDETVREVTRLIEKYQFSLAGETLRDFTWNEFADWYVEIHKVEKNDAVLQHVFETLLKLWHPFMPFVTEALWSSLEKKSFLMVTHWPEAHNEIAKLREQSSSFSHIIDIITAIRNARSENNISPKQPVDIIFTGTREPFLRSNQHIIQQCARINSIAFDEKTPNQHSHAIHLVIGRTHISMFFEKHIDLSKERARIEKEIAQLEQYIANTAARLENKSFLEKAPAELVENTKQLLVEKKQECETLKQYLKSLQ